MIKIKRIYEDASPEDGMRIFVDRLWPRGMKKEDAHFDLWLKDIAPSSSLRKWFGHDPNRWPEFKAKYMEELKLMEEELSIIIRAEAEGTVTLLYAARDVRHNEAVVIKDFVKHT